MKEEAGTARRPGRRPGTPATRDAILAAARTEFAERGYGGARIRDIAARADVDPALVHYFFGTKSELFAAAMALPFNPSTIVRPLLADGVDGLGERVVRRMLEVWGDPATQESLLAMIHSVSSRPEAADALRQFIEREIQSRIAAELDGPDARLRATLAGSQIVGLLMMRHVLRLEPVASADPEHLAAIVGPALQRYLTGPLP